MEKNVIVTDEFENEIGLTYPKRARGLVKNGRAEYVSDCKIRLLNYAHTHAPTEKMEESIMSNVIQFNARDFMFDPSISPTAPNAPHIVNNVGSRLFVTNFDGTNTEVFEIGDWQWSWSQIKCTKQLEPNTEYLFRFAVTGGYNNENEQTSQFVIYSDENFEDRYVYELNRSRYAPLMSKKWGESIVRVYEVPFNSGESGNITFVFIAQHAVLTVMPALENEAYSELEDHTLAQWWEDMCKCGDPLDGRGGTKRSIDLSGAVIYDMNKLRDILFDNSDSDIDLSGAVIGENCEN